MEHDNIEIDASFNKQLKASSQIDFSFLTRFKRSQTEYQHSKEPSILDAYQSGLYDAILNILGDSNLKVTGRSHHLDEVKKFLRQVSFAAELTLSDNLGNQIKSIVEQEKLAERWLKENKNNSVYTHLILMIPKDNDRSKLSKIVLEFLKQQFSQVNYIFIEHTDTDIFHYHLIVERELPEDLLREMQAAFIALCLKYNTKLL